MQLSSEAIDLRPKRLCVFAHYDPHGLVDPHVQFLLAALHAICDELIFVSTAGATQSYLDSLCLPASKIITRPNVGLDFYSWKLGLESARPATFDEIVLCNDSVYGPLFPLADVLKEMRHRSCDFWGITDNLQIHYHLQSYFLVFKADVIRSRAFETFWRTVQPLVNKQEVISRYEAGLTSWLMKNDFKPAAYFKPKLSDLLKANTIALKKARWASMKEANKVQTFLETYKNCRKSRKLNKTHYFWLEMVHQKAPFLKIELLKTNPERREISEVLPEIQNASTYPVTLIRQHQKRIGGIPYT